MIRHALALGLHGNSACAAGSLQLKQPSLLRSIAALEADLRRAAVRPLGPGRCVMADLLARLGRHNEARTIWRRAADLTRNARERELLLARMHNTPPEGDKP